MLYSSRVLETLGASAPDRFSQREEVNAVPAPLLPSNSFCRNSIRVSENDLGY